MEEEPTRKGLQNKDMDPEPTVGLLLCPLLLGQSPREHTARYKNAPDPSPRAASPLALGPPQSSFL